MKPSTLPRRLAAAMRRVSAARIGRKHLPIAAACAFVAAVALSCALSWALRSLLGASL